MLSFLGFISICYIGWQVIGYFQYMKQAKQDIESMKYDMLKSKIDRLEFRVSELEDL